MPLAVALIMSAAIYFFSAPILTVHGKLTRSLLSLTRIPTSGDRLIEIFPVFRPAVIPDVPFPPHRANPMRTASLFAATLTGFYLIQRRFPLGRNFVIFLAILLFAAAGMIVFAAGFNFSSAAFAQIWLRAEVLVWLILPWMSSFVFILVLPSVARGIAWAVLLELYVILWSALRLAFCLGTMHFTGILYLPMLWFCLGILFDLVCLVFFYSLALYDSLRRVERERTS